MYLSHVHNLRALAIILIVSAHTIGFFVWEKDSFVRSVLEDLVGDSTVLFVFISGYLFQHLSGKYRYTDYLRRKAKNVLIPYIVVSIPAIVHGVFLHDATALYSVLEGKSVPYQIAWFYIRGGAHINYPLWYIPVILLYFAAAPLFMQVVQYPRAYWLLVLLIPVSVLAHRPEAHNPDLVHSCVYFLSAYVLGMGVSQYRDQVESVLDRNLGAAVLLFVCVFLVHLFFAGQHGNYHVAYVFSTEKGIIDWMFLQKLLLALVLIGVLKRYDSKMPRQLGLLASASFSTYFLHAYVLYAFHVILKWQAISGGFWQWLMLTVLVIGVCLAITRGIQLVAGKYSRLLIGS